MNEIRTNISEELTLKEFLIKFNDWCLFVLKKWKLICLFGFIGGLIGFIYASYKKPIYTAKITFVLEEGKSIGSNLGGLASLAGQLGVDVNGASGAGLLSGDNILLYFKSPTLAREVLLSAYDSKSEKSIADVYSKVYGLSESWKNNKKIGPIYFPIYKENSTYSRLQDSLLHEIITVIIKKQFIVGRTDKKAGFIDVSSSMQDELLSKIYCERIVEKVVEKYISIKTQRQNSTVQKLQIRADSISNLLKQKTFSGASLQNSSSTMDINPLYRTGTSVAVETTTRDKTLLSTIFANVVQNLEIAKFTLSQETPVIQIVDSPILPLKKDKLSRLKSAIVCSFILGFLTFLVIILKKIVFDTLQE